MVKDHPEWKSNEPFKSILENIMKSLAKQGEHGLMQWTASNTYKSFMLYVHHTDAEREWAYDRDSHIGKLDKGLDQAKKVVGLNF